MKPFLHEQLTRSLVVEIASGFYKEGARFLSSRKIRRIWGISATTAIRSLDQLIELKLIAPEPRSGFRVLPEAQERALLLLHKQRSASLPPPETWKSKRQGLLAPNSAQQFRVAVVFDRGKTSGVEMHRQLPPLIVSDLECARSFFTEGMKHNYDIFFYLYNGTASSQNKIVDSLIQNQIHGVALFRRAYASNVCPVTIPLIRRNIPVVTVFDSCKETEALSVNINNIATGYEAMDTFLKHKHRRMLFVAGSRPNEFIEERLKGFRLALSEANIPNSGVQVARIPYNRPISPETIRRIEKMLRDPENSPTAAFFPSTLLLRKFLPILKESRLRIPKDFSIICCGSADLLPEKEFPFDLMGIDFRDIGRVACQSLFRVMTGDPTERSILLDATYISRGSTANPEETACRASRCSSP